jgi:type I restriction enzyme S subunit
MPFQQTKFSTFLAHRKQFIQIRAAERYKRARVRLHWKGIVLRDEVEGALIKTKDQQIARHGELLVAEIDAKVGGVGILPPGLDGAIVSSHYFLFKIDESKCLGSWLDWFIRSGGLSDQFSARGSTNYAAIRPHHVLNCEMPLPPLGEQRRIVTRIEEFSCKINQITKLSAETRAEQSRMLLAAYQNVIEGAEWLSMESAAPLVRRPVQVEPLREYHELGIRSFGKGTFHKPFTTGVMLGSKRIFRIEPGDLLFNIVFAWEGAVAVAQPQDRGRVGSHRFLSCVPTDGQIVTSFLAFHFLTDQGLEDLGTASPGGAGRNRTLGIEALAKIKVPVPAPEKQRWFNSLLQRAEKADHVRVDAAAEIDALMPSILAKAFRGEL